MKGSIKHIIILNGLFWRNYLLTSQAFHCKRISSCKVLHWSLLWTGMSTVVKSRPLIGLRDQIHASDWSVGLPCSGLIMKSVFKVQYPSLRWIFHFTVDISGMINTNVHRLPLPALLADLVWSTWHQDINYIITRHSEKTLKIVTQWIKMVSWRNEY